LAAPKILPRPGGRGCAKNPADRKFTLSSRFAFHLPFWSTLIGGNTLSVASFGPAAALSFFILATALLEAQV
jgi:hypothetical protein